MYFGLCSNSFFLKNLFLCGQLFLKFLLNLLQYCFCFMFSFFGCKPCGILSPNKGSSLHTPRLKGVSASGQQGSPACICISSVHLFSLECKLHEGRDFCLLCLLLYLQCLEQCLAKNKYLLSKGISILNSRSKHPLYLCHLFLQ